MLEKLKLWLLDDEPYYAMLVFLVGITAFGLGLLSKTAIPGEHQAAAVYLPADVSPPRAHQTSVSSSLGSSGPERTVVASENGSRFHLPTCPGAGQIHAENRIEFPTIAAASAAGYTPAKNCPELSGGE